MRLRPALVLAAPVGVLGGHAIGYLAAPGPAGAEAVHHGYLALAFAVAVPLAVMAVAWAATTGATGGATATATDTAGRATATAGRAARAARPVPVGPLLLAQWMLFTAQEAVEHAAAGHGAAAALHSPALRWGLAAQVVTAAAVVVLLRASAVTGARLAVLLGGRPLVVLHSSPLGPPRPATPPRSTAVVASPSRGPPAARFA